MKFNFKGMFIGNKAFLDFLIKNVDDDQQVIYGQRDEWTYDIEVRAKDFI